MASKFDEYMLRMLVVIVIILSVVTFTSVVNSRKAVLENRRLILENKEIIISNSCLTTLNCDEIEHLLDSLAHIKGHPDECRQQP